MTYEVVLKSRKVLKTLNNPEKTKNQITFDKKGILNQTTLSVSYSRVVCYKFRYCFIFKA